MPEFMGFRQRRGIKPTKKPRQPCFLIIFLVQQSIFVFYKLTLLLMTSKGWLKVIAKAPARKAGQKVLYIPKI